jgi:3-phenylpropionate/trans-cinnamate dioxygenase ferredoxin component
MTQFESVFRTQDLGPGTVAEVAAHGQQLALANVGQQYFAFEAHCPEDGSNLARYGRLEGDCLVCPGDHPAFDVRTGDMVDGGEATLRRYAIRVEENTILVGPPLSL